MESFKRTPTIRILAAEVRDTTVELQSGGDQYSPNIFLSPTGAEVNRVLITGTAVEKEDVGSDNSFWRVRVADPTGAIFVYAGQYQPEAAKVIQKLDVPCFLIVSGKLAHYTPEQGGDTIVSIRAESISSVNGTAVTPPTAPASQPVPPSTPAVTTPSPPPVPAPAAETKPVTEQPIKPHVPEPVKAPAVTEKQKRNRKKGVLKKPLLIR